MEERPASILVVDDTESNRILLKDMLEAAGHQVWAVAGGAEGIEIAAAEHPDVILLDVNMPGMDGFEVCRRLKSLAETSAIPIVFITANYTEEQDLLYGLQLGGNDYLIKPISRSVLLARVGVMLRIRRTEEKMRQMSMVDEFTGLFSKTYVLQRLDEEMERAQRRRSTLALAMLDLDDFKMLNDNFGHQFGDEVLKRISASLKANVRAYDSVGRYGGEEFLLVLPELAEAEAVAAIGRLKDKVGEERFSPNGHEIGVTFSAGISFWDHTVKADELIRHADDALYAAKRAGKNQTVRYSQMTAGGVSGPAAHSKGATMKRLLIGIVTGGTVLVAGAASAEVNCAQVNRYLQTGRSVQDVSETMVVAEDEVKKCQAQGAGAEKGQGGQDPAAGGVPATSSKTDKSSDGH
jgi:diguanylate cyclase (GGDEF)-like protein